MKKFFSHFKEHAHQSPWNPVGRISKLGKMLLIDSDEPLYIPVTQDPGRLTFLIFVVTQTQKKFSF